MGKWEMVRLGDVCQFINGDRGVNYPSKKDFIEAGVPFINAGHLNNKSIDFSEMNYISFEKYMQLGSGKVRNGDILYCLRGSLGKQAVVKDFDFGAIASSLVIIRPLSEVAVKYLSYCLESSKVLKQQLQANTGSSQPNLSATNVKNYSIPLPPLDEQKRIAQNLDLASEIVKGYKDQLAELDKLVQSVFYEMFGDPVTNEKGWKITCLGEVCKKVTDGTHNSPENSVTGEYRYITAKNIKRDGILLSNITYVTKQVHEEIYARCNPEIGDVLYIKDGVTTGIAVVNTLNEPFSMLSSVALLKLKETICNKYLCNVLNCKEMYQKIRENMGGAAITRLTLVKIKNIQIPLPPLPLQTHFASIVTDIEAQKAKIQQALTEAENLFNSLMQEYFE